MLTVGLSKVDIQNLEFDKWSCLPCKENLFPFNKLSEDEECFGTVCNTVLYLNLFDQMLFSPFDVHEVRVEPFGVH